MFLILCCCAPPLGPMGCVHRSCMAPAPFKKKKKQSTDLFAKTAPAPEEQEELETGTSARNHHHFLGRPWLSIRGQARIPRLRALVAATTAKTRADGRKSGSKVPRENLLNRESGCRLLHSEAVQHQPFLKHGPRATAFSHVALAPQSSLLDSLGPRAM